MHARLATLRFRMSLIAGSLALVAPLFAVAAGPVPAAAVRVKVFPDHYAVNEKQFADVAALEAWMQPVRAGMLSFDDCGPASTRALIAAVERFHSTYAAGIEIGALPAEEPGCSTNISASSAELAYHATDELGRSIMP